MDGWMDGWMGVRKEPMKEICRSGSRFDENGNLNSVTFLALFVACFHLVVSCWMFLLPNIFLNGFLLPQPSRRL
jgi:hypothetical protein